MSPPIRGNGQGTATDERALVGKEVACSRPRWCCWSGSDQTPELGGAATYLRTEDGRCRGSSSLTLLGACHRRRALTWLRPGSVTTSASSQQHSSYVRLATTSPTSPRANASTPGCHSRGLKALPAMPPEPGARCDAGRPMHNALPARLRDIQAGHMTRPASSMAVDLRTVWASFWPWGYCRRGCRPSGPSAAGPASGGPRGAGTNASVAASRESALTIGRPLTPAFRRSVE
jgi:hypothetical protein